MYFASHACIAISTCASKVYILSSIRNLNQNFLQQTHLRKRFFNPLLLQYYEQNVVKRDPPHMLDDQCPGYSGLFQ